MKHTPGPWKVGDIYGKRIKDIWIDALGQTCPVARINITKMENNENVWANAHLIAAAPDLLEALKTAKDALDYCYFQKGIAVLKELQFVEQAISKAEGK